MLRTTATFALLALVVACGPKKPGSDDDGDDNGSNGPHVLSQVVVSPLNPIVQLDLNATGAQAFTLTGMYEDNTTEDLTAYGAPPPEQVIAHTNLYWQHQRAPGRTAGAVAAGEIVFRGE